MSHAMRAADAIRAGRAKVVVVSYASGVRSWPIPGYWDELGYPYGPGAFELAYSPTTVAQYGLLATRHMAEFGTTPEQLARVAVTCRTHARGNPHAKYRDPLTVEDVLSSPMIANPLHRLDCCVLTESGGAIVITGADRARNCARKPVWLAGYGECAGELWMSQKFRSDVSPGLTSARLAFEMAGVKPKDVDVAQLYDAFTITPIIALEDLGFCKQGDTGPYIESGAIDETGELPINTDGGGLSSNHPGRRRMFVMIEAVRQLRGESPGVQVRDPEVSLAHGIGSIYASAATMILTV
jgi:acetyl-CoA acetyltransferase